MVFSTKRKPAEENEENDEIDEVESLDLNDDSDTSDEERNSEDEEDDDDDDEEEENDDDEEEEELVYEDDDEELQFEDSDDDSIEKIENKEINKTKNDSKKENLHNKNLSKKQLNKTHNENMKENVSKSLTEKKLRNTLEKKDNVKNKKSDKNDKEEKKVEEMKGDEYDVDSSDEEDIRNTVGNIPKEWYKHYDHIGYDLDGLKIGKKGLVNDELDNFINRMDDPNYWRSVRDKWTGGKVVLSDDDIKLIRKYLRGKYTEKSIDQTPEFEEPFVRETMLHPLTNHPENKGAYGVSKWEKLKIGQLVHSMKMGWIKVGELKKDEDDEEEDDVDQKFYSLWNDSDEPSKRIRQHIAANKMPLPGHAESYNPPPEYLFTPEEEKKWRETDPAERRINFIPRKFSSLRSVPGYDRFVSERFERCLDLYLCPRKIKMRANVKAEDLLPKLPSPRDLQPFPTTQALMYKGHTGAVRSLTFHPSGEIFASGSEDHNIRLWEVASGRCVSVIKMSGPVNHLQWNPSPKLSMLAAAVGDTVYLINTLIGPQVLHTDSYLATSQQEEGGQVTWENLDHKHIRVAIKHPKEVQKVCWQGKGDYMAVVLHQGLSLSLLLHRISTRTTMNPFSKPKGIIQCVCFHPSKPILFVATQQYIRVYHLVKQLMTRKLMPGCKWISSMAIHPWGDNLIVGTYDSRLSWFDTQLSDKPYQTLRHHKSAIRDVCFHKSLPLFASCSDDGSVIVCHGKVYNDLSTNALLVPVKVLRGHVKTKGLGVLSCQFHPTLPWIVSAGADHTIRLYS